MQERLLGAMYGHLVGDAFGVPYEFKHPGELPAEIEWRGYGTHNQPVGTWSDDGALMLCLVASLTAQGRFDPEDVGRRFVDWRDRGYMAAGGVVFDIGNTTYAAIERLRLGVPPLEAGLASERDNGNGSLMRILPLALWTTSEPAEGLMALCQAGSKFTHGHPCAQVCCAVYGLILQRLLCGAKRRDAWTDALATAERTYLSASQWGEPFQAELNRIQAFKRCRGTGFVVDCLRTAWEAVCEARDFADAVCRAVRYGNDTDTTAAVAGSLAGAHFGLSSVPPTWRAELRLSKEQRLIIDQFAALVASRRGRS